jgi:CBS domain-containing protein
MKTIYVKDLMVPLDEYATVSEEATLFEAVVALEKAQEKLDRTRFKYLHRAILVYDKNNNIVGKISQLDVLRALEPKYGEMGDQQSIARFGFSQKFLQSLREQFSLLDRPFDEACKKAAQVKVKTFMYTPTEGEYVEEDASLDVAIHRLVMGHHQSLLVTRGKKIVGILKLTDVFAEIFQTMKGCELEGGGQDGLGQKHQTSI